MIKAVTLYARVSSERQVRQAMRASQRAVLRARAAADDLVVLPSDEYVDDGHHRSTLRCPALERLRDRAAQGAVDTLCLDRSLNFREDEPPTLARTDRRAEIRRRLVPMIKAVALHVRVSSERQVQQATIASQLAVLCARAVTDGYVVLSGDEYVANGASDRRRVPPRSNGRAVALRKARWTRSAWIARCSLSRREDEQPTLARADQRAEIPRRFAP
jgi:hypothetical protein